MSRNRLTVAAITGAATLSLLAQAASAAALLEFNFQTAASGAAVDTSASAAKSGTSNTAVLNGANLASGKTQGNATITAGAVPGLPGGSSNFISSVGNGYMTITRPSNGDGNDSSGLQMKDTDASAYSNAEYRDYVGSNRWGTSTLLFVYQPGFNGTTTYRHTLFASGYDGSTDAGMMLNFDTNLGIYLGSGVTGRKGSATVATPVWDSTKWYVIAASWQTGSAPTIYYRELAADPSAGSGTFAISGSALTDGINELIRVPSIGVRSSQTSSNLLGENAQGKIAYFQWTDQYTGTQAGFDAIYSSLYIPEPASFALVGLAAAALGMKRSRR